MARCHVTVSLMTCLVLIGVCFASSLRSFGLDHPEQAQSQHRMSVQESSPNRLVEHNLTTASQAPIYDPPQCTVFACPPSKVLADRGSYRKVFFPEAVYAKCRREGESMMPSFKATYHRLFRYYDGDNSKKEKLPCTAPVILRVDPAQPHGMFIPKNFTLFFYMDPKVKSPPNPMEKDIEVLLVNSYTLYIRTFSSYPMTYADWMHELLQLAADVEADGESYRQDFYYFASYDLPSHFTHRINEVQLLVPNADDLGL